jgi:hypothetical protein
MTQKWIDMPVVGYKILIADTDINSPNFFSSPETHSIYISNYIRCIIRSICSCFQSHFALDI